jgi:siroheme synthase
MPTVQRTDSGDVFLFTRAQAESLAVARMECEELAVVVTTIGEAQTHQAGHDPGRRLLSHAIAFLAGAMTWELAR